MKQIIKSLKRQDKAKVVRYIQNQQTKRGDRPTPFKVLIAMSIKDLAVLVERYMR